MDNRKYDIEKYLKGELTPAEMHALEKEALNDPFLAEALEGAEEFARNDFSKDIAELNGKFIKRRTIKHTWPLRIAASLLLITVAAIIIWSALDHEPEQLAINNTTITRDSITETIQPQLPSTPQSSLAQTESKKQTPQAPAPTVKNLSKKSASELIVGSKKLKQASETSKRANTKNEYRVKTLKREKPLDQKNEVTKIPPGKKDELMSPAARDIKIVEGYIASVDARPTLVTGWVMSAEDGTPLPDVDIAVKGSSIKTKTDAYGRYAITANSQNKTLVYSSEGLESTEVKIDGIDSTYLPVKLEITEEAQKEAVVETSAFREYFPTHILTIPAHPESGNRIFKQYLQRNYKYPEEAKEAKIEGTVVIEFKVDVTGSLSEFKILRGIGRGCDEEVIRLILQGTKWIPTTQDGVPISDKARVRFKFQLEK